MGESDTLEKWRGQIRKGFLELCVLAMVDRLGETYGLDLQERLSTHDLEVAEGTLYPLLTRMTKEGSLAATWNMPLRGHPRKYYRLEERGREFLAVMRVEYRAAFDSWQAIENVPGIPRDAESEESA
ncbi:MAG: PadR family transcriptional regulator [Spirochaetota bacterium]